MAGLESYMGPAPEDDLTGLTPEELAKMGIMSQVQNNPYERMQRQAAQNVYEQQFQDAAMAQQAGINQLDRYIQDFAQQPTGIDWTGLAAVADSLRPGGGNTLAVAKATKPMSQEEKNAALIKLQDMLQTQRGKLTHETLGPLVQQNKLLQAIKDQSKTDRMERNLDIKMFDKARGEQGKLVKEAADFKNSYNNVENAITPDEKGTVSVARVSQALSQFSRLMGEKGVLTDTDIGRQLSPTLDLWSARLKGMLESNPNQRVSVQNVAALTEALGASKEAFKQSYNLKANAFKKTYFENPGSPYANKPWAPTLVEEIYKPLEMFSAPGGAAGGAVDLVNAAKAELAKRKKK